MKFIVTIFSILVSWTIVSAQLVIPSDSQRVENSKYNYRYALVSKGKKVGSGLCRDFVYAAIKRNHKNDLKDVLVNAKYFEIKDRSKIMNGDVVTFKNVIYRNDTIKYHIGIVVCVNERGFFYAHQNAGDVGDKTVKVIDENGKECNVFKGSKVESAYFEYSDKRSGMVQFFRF